MRPARAAVGLLAAMTWAAGCGAVHSAVGPVAPRTSLGIARATQIFDAYTEANNLVNSRYWTARDRTIEEPPASLGSIASLRVAKAEGKVIPANQYFGTRIAVPKVTGYPRLLLATTHLRSDGTTLPYTIYFLFVQDEAGMPWRVAYYPFTTGQVPVPAVATSANDSTPAVTSAAGLLADPSALNAALYAHATGQHTAAPAIPLAPTPDLNDQLTAGYISGVQEYNAHGVNVYQALLPITFPIYLIRTRGGGALAFTADEVRDVLVPRHRGVRVHLPPGSANAAVAGKPNGTSAARYSIVRLQMFMSYIPPRDSGGGVELLSYADYPLSVTH